MCLLLWNRVHASVWKQSAWCLKKSLQQPVHSSSCLRSLSCQSSALQAKKEDETGGAASERVAVGVSRPHLQMVYSCCVHASQAYVNRFRGASSAERTRTLPRDATTFSSALMNSMLWASAETHIAEVKGEQQVAPEERRRLVKRMGEVLQTHNVASERSITTHAATIERLVQFNQPHVFHLVQYQYALMVRLPRRLFTSSCHRLRDNAFALQ